MNKFRRYRSKEIANKIIGLSLSYEPQNLLSRGMGLEHLRELLIHLTRPLLRQGAHLAYGGNWKPEKTEGENLTFELLRLISAEQEETTSTDTSSSKNIGMLYNHAAWPHYLDITPKIEAQWINCCQIIRFTQKAAGIQEIAADDEARESDRAILNAAITLGVMRQTMMKEIKLDFPDVPTVTIPPVSISILLGGKLADFSGFMPGIFEEALCALENRKPLYIIGGFGGASEILANCFLSPSSDRPTEMTLPWLLQQNKIRLPHLLQIAQNRFIPQNCLLTAPGLDKLYHWISSGRSNPASTLNTGLTDAETRELLLTRDVERIVQLIHKGLSVTVGMKK